MSTDLITEHLDLWTSAVTYTNGKGRGNNGGPELTGIDKLRELILELAVRGKLVPQDPEDEPASKLLERIEGEKARLYKEGKIKKPKKLPEVAEEEKSFELPDGWSWVRLGEIAFPQAGFAFKSREFNFDGNGLPLIRIRDVGQPFSGTYYSGDYREEFVVEPGDYLVSMDGVFRVARWDGGRALLNQRVTRLIFYSEELTQRFIAENLQFHLEKLQGVKAYTTVDHLSGKQIGESVVALPPAEEQQRIVEKLDELMALCDRLEQQTSDQLNAHETLVDTLLDTLTRSQDAAELAENWARLAAHFDTLFTTEHSIDRLEQTILQLAVMGRLVPQDPNDEPACKLLERIEGEKERLYTEGKSKKPKQTPDVGEEEKPFSVPKNWVWGRIGHLTTQITDGVHKTPNYKEEGVPFISVKDIDGKTVSFDGAKFISEEQHKEINRRCNPEKGDMLICRIGTLGRPTIVDTDRPFSIFVSVGLLKYPTYFLMPEYFHLVLKSPFMAAQYQEIKAGGSHTNKLNLGDIPKLVVPVPPHSEQQRISAKVSELTALCDRLKAQLAEASQIQTQLAESLVKETVA